MCMCTSSSDICPYPSTDLRQPLYIYIKLILYTYIHTYILLTLQQGDTALHAASLNGHGDCVGIICSTAWEWSVLNAVNNKGYTPAHVAGSAEALQVLYEYGADVFLTNNANRTPLFTAAAKGLTQNVEFLLCLCDAQHPDGADTVDTNGDTPLHAGR